MRKTEGLKDTTAEIKPTPWDGGTTTISVDGNIVRINQRSMHDPGGVTVWVEKTELYAAIDKLQKEGIQRREQEIFRGFDWSREDICREYAIGKLSKDRIERILDHLESIEDLLRKK